MKQWKCSAWEGLMIWMCMYQLVYSHSQHIGSVGKAFDVENLTSISWTPYKHINIINSFLLAKVLFRTSKCYNLPFVIHQQRIPPGYSHQSLSKYLFHFSYFCFAHWQTLMQLSLLMVLLYAECSLLDLSLAMSTMNKFKLK